MKFLLLKYPITLLVFLIPFNALVLATPAISIDQFATKHSPILHRNSITLVGTDKSLLPTLQPDYSSTLYRSLQRREHPLLWQIRVGTLYMLHSFNRMSAILSPSEPSATTKNLKKMYSDIRRAAINEWARLPEQSYIRVVFGQIVFTLLPPADRTVPWSIVEEVAYSLLLMVSAGLGGFVSGMYFPIATSAAVWYYLQVIAPVPPGTVDDSRFFGDGFAPGTARGSGGGRRRPGS
ncbi:MAG: hypothetical protein L6R41_004284 [Letrouitia leprolyta]|nr:MAG: hypothetical protein L6R41_004284 [Letrouitia leprolyta]